MQVTETLSDGLKRAYTVVVPAADLEGRRSKRLAELGRTVRLPGFRPGKVPAQIIRQRFGSAVNAEVLEESVTEATRQVMDERKLRSALQPKVELVKAEPAQDLEFKVELEVLPEIALPDLTTIELTRLKAEPQPEAVEAALAEIARRQRSFEDVEEERGAERGEVLQLDFTATIEGQPFAGNSGTDMLVEVGGVGFIPTFTAQLEGMRVGESRTIEATFPEDYPAKDVAGKAARFEVTAKKLKRAVVPAVDEALAEKFGFENLAELRETLVKQMEREYAEMSRARLKRQLLDVLAAMVSFPVPEGLVESEFAGIWSGVEEARRNGQLDEEDKAKDEEALKADYRAIAERRVRLGLLLAEIGRANAISVGEDELLRAMRADAARYPGQESRVMDFYRKNPAAAEAVRGRLLEEKVVDFIVGRAQVRETVVTVEELAREPEAPQMATAPAPAEPPAAEAATAEAPAGQTAGAEA